MDFALRLVGPLTSLAALTTVRYPTVVVDGGGPTLHRTVPDHVLVHGRLTGGGALDVQVVGGCRAGDTPFRMDVVGEDGTVTLTGGAARGFQAGLLDLQLDGEPVPVDAPVSDLIDSAANVAGLYAALRDDITDDSLGKTRSAPDFGHAVQLSHLIDDLLVSADQHRTVTPTADWPGRS